MPAAAAIIPAVIGAGTSVAGSIMQGRAAKSAAQVQADAAAEMRRRAEAAGQAGGDAVEGAGEKAAMGLEQTAAGAATDVQQAAAAAAARFGLSVEQANELLRGIYGDTMDRLNPYAEQGTAALRQLSEMAGSDGAAAKPYTMDDLMLDPGYQFRQKEGQKAFEASAAARGGGLSGGTLKAIAKYGQEMASDEYAKAFDRARSQRVERAGLLRDLLSVGQRATETGINVAQNVGTRAAQNLMAGGEYAGTMGYRGASDAADYRYRGASEAGRTRLSAVSDAARLRLSGTMAGNDAIADGANATAAGKVAGGRTWGNVLSTIGNTAADVVSTSWKPQSQAKLSDLNRIQNQQRATKALRYLLPVAA